MASVEPSNEKLERREFVQAPARVTHPTESPNLSLTPRTSFLKRSRASRAAFATLGLVFLSLAIIGIWTPVLPSTINAILALACFKRGNERLENWLLNHPVIGPTLRDWEETRSITRRTKIAAIVMIWAAIGISCLFVKKTWVLGMLPCVAIALTAYLWTRKTKV